MTMKGFRSADRIHVCTNNTKLLNSSLWSTLLGLVYLGLESPVTGFQVNRPRQICSSSEHLGYFNHTFHPAHCCSSCYIVFHQASLPCGATYTSLVHCKRHLQMPQAPPRTTNCRLIGASPLSLQPHLSCPVLLRPL